MHNLSPSSSLQNEYTQEQNYLIMQRHPCSPFLLFQVQVFNFYPKKYKFSINHGSVIVDLQCTYTAVLTYTPSSLWISKFTDDLFLSNATLKNVTKLQQEHGSPVSSSCGHNLLTHHQQTGSKRNGRRSIKMNPKPEPGADSGKWVRG